MNILFGAVNFGSLSKDDKYADGFYIVKNYLYHIQCKTKPSLIDKLYRLVKCFECNLPQN